MTTTDHIEAVARVLTRRPECACESRYMASTHVFYHCDTHDAETILDSTDPAVHAAMLDALTRHGVLTEQRVRICPACEEGRGHPYCLDTNERRLVTSWEVSA